MCHLNRTPAHGPTPALRAGQAACPSAGFGCPEAGGVADADAPGI